MVHVVSEGFSTLSSLSSLSPIPFSTRNQMANHLTMILSMTHLPLHNTSSFQRYRDNVFDSLSHTCTCVRFGDKVYMQLTNSAQTFNFV